MERSLGVPSLIAKGDIFVQLWEINDSCIYFPNGSGKERDNSRVPINSIFTNAFSHRR